MKFNTYKFLNYFVAITLLVAGYTFIAPQNSYASIVYDQLSDTIISTSTLIYQTNSKWATSTRDYLIDYADNNYAEFDKTSNTDLGTLDIPINSYQTPVPLPVGSILDAVCFSAHMYSTSANFNGFVYFILNNHRLAGVSYAITSTPAYYNFCYDSTNINSSYLSDFTLAKLNTTATAGINIYKTTSTGSQFMIDSFDRYTWYHYDDSLSISRINSLNISSLNSTTYPNIVSSTSTLTTTYYKNSADSTGYTKLQYKVHNFFTNQDILVLSNAITTNTTYATSTITNFCNGGLMYCVNGDTFQLAVRFSNNDGSVVSSWFPTYYYFVYISQYTPPTATTSTIIINPAFPPSTGGTVDIQSMYSDCGITDLYGCFKNALIWTFIPDSTSTSQLFNGFQEAYKNKPPFGYFTQISSVLNNATTTATSTTFSLGQAVQSSGSFYTLILSPFRTGMSVLIYLLLCYVIFKRFQHFEF